MVNSGPSRTLSALLWGGGILLAALLVFFGVRKLGGAGTVEVRVVPASYQSLSKTVSANGKVEPIGEWQAHAPFPGVIKKLYVGIGQRVSKGMLLVKMDDSGPTARVASAEGVLAAAELTLHDLQNGGSHEERARFSSDLDFAKLDHNDAVQKYAALQQLYGKGAASQSEVTAAQQRLRATELTLQTAQARNTDRFGSGDLVNARARVADAQANLLAAKNALSDVDMRAPQNGTVYSVPISESDYVPAGDDILDLADLTHVQIRAYFDEPEIGGLARGQLVNIVWEAKPGVVWHGHIEQAPTTVITYGTRSVGECMITVDDTRGDLLPNTNVTATVTEMKKDHVLTVPREALHTDGMGTFVYRIINGGLVRTPVEVGAFNLTSEEIVAGLKVGDLVVLAPKSTSVELASGLKVKAVS